MEAVMRKSKLHISSVNQYLNNPTDETKYTTAWQYTSLNVKDDILENVCYKMIV